MPEEYRTEMAASRSRRRTAEDRAREEQEAHRLYGNWHYGDMARVKTTLSIDEELMRHLRVRAARTGRTNPMFWKRRSAKD